MEFTEIAIKIINEINEKYETAYSDLEKIIGSLENSLKTIIPGLKFKMPILNDGPTGTIVALVLDPNSEDSRIEVVKITDFFIPSSGYPIEYGKFSKALEDFDTDGQLTSANEVETFFKNMVTDSDSRIIQAIGYAARRRNRS